MAADAVNNQTNLTFSPCSKVSMAIHGLLIITALVIGILSQCDLINSTTTSNLLITLALFDIAVLISNCLQRKALNKYVNNEFDKAFALGLQQGQNLPPGQPEVIDLDPRAARQEAARQGIQTVHPQPERPQSGFKAFRGNGHRLGGT